MDHNGSAHPAPRANNASLVALRSAISATIRAHRAQTSLSQRELAAVVGCSQSLIARLESGTGDPTLSSLLRVLSVCRARLVVPEAPLMTRMRGEYARDEADRRLPAHLEPYRLDRPHSWWPGQTQILMWHRTPKWSYRRRR